MLAFTLKESILTVTFTTFIIGWATSLIFAALSRQTALRSLAQPALLKLLEEFRSATFKADNHFIYEDLNNHYSGLGLRELPPAVRARVLSVMHFYDHLALMTKAGIVKQKYVIAFMGDSICRTWCALEPFIKDRR